MRRASDDFSTASSIERRTTMKDSAPPKYIGQVTDVRAGSEIDVARLHKYLAGTVKGFTGPLQVRQFDGGQSNPTYLLITPDSKYVLRRKPSGTLLKSAHAVDREFSVMDALFRTGRFPVPEPLVLCGDESVIGTMFYVMRHVEGRIFWDCAMPDLRPSERAAVFDEVNETLARLHAFVPASIGLADFGKPGNYFARQIQRWARQYDSSKTEDIQEMDRLMAWLPGALPSEEDRICIAHGDYSFHNVLVHPSLPKVVGVLDWELSTIGHPLGDLMYHAMDWYRPAGVASRGTLQGRDLAALGIPTMEAYVDRYCERAGYRFSGNFAFYRAFNLFRVAAILQGIAHRAIQGNAASGNASEIGTRVRVHAQAAWSEALLAGAV
jgi:aminoglycoside phosphotransferase (APT) family kinase protein